MSSGYKETMRDMGFSTNGKVDAVDAVDAVTGNLPESKTFPVDALPGPCGTLVREAAESIGCPPEFVALPMLACLGSAIGNSRVVQLKAGWEESPAIYGAILADPGEKKTPAYKVAIEPATRVQGSLREDYRKRLDEYQRELRAYKVEEKESHKAGEPAPPPPREPVMTRAVVEDVTVEALAGVLEDNPRGVLAVRDELAAWARSMDQYKSGGKGSDRQFWLSAWSSSYASVDRKGRAEPLMLQRPFTCVFGSMQPAILPELGDGRDDGLLDRFVFAYPDPVRSRWTDAEISSEARDGYRRLYDGLRGLYQPADGHGDPEPVRVYFAHDARAVFVDVVDAHRAEMEAPGFPLCLRGPWSKLEAYLARLALILATARAFHQGEPERLEVRDVLAAVKLVDYFKTHARRVYVGLHGENSDDRLAADVAEFLRAREGYFKDEPATLHGQLKSKHKPAQPAELTKALRRIAARTPRLEFKDGNFKVEGQSRRFVELTLKETASTSSTASTGESGAVM